MTMNQELKEKLYAEARQESNDLMDKGRAELALDLLRWIQEQES